MDHESRVAAYLIFFTLLIMKLVTAVIILIMIPNKSVVEFFILTNWIWFVPVLGLLGTAGLFWMRMIKMRARRGELLRQEFAGEAPTAVPPVFLASDWRPRSSAE